MTVRVVVVTLAVVLGACAGADGTQTAMPGADTVPSLPSSGVTRASGDIDDPILCLESADSTTRLKRHVYCLRESEWVDRADSDREALKAVRKEVPLPR